MLRNVSVNMDFKHVPSYLCVLKVMSPERPDLVLTANIPNSETDIFIFHCLHIETCRGHRSGQSYLHFRTLLEFTKTSVLSYFPTDGGNSGYNFSKLQFVQYCCFSCSIQPNCGDLERK